MTTTSFQTFRPKNPVVAEHVDYYYLDRKPTNVVATYECFPHYNNTISLYAAHRFLGEGKVEYDPSAPPLQIFTPVRERVLQVEQTGPVHRVVIVFRVLGVQQFWRGLSFGGYHLDCAFFSPEELRELFATDDIALLVLRLDTYLRGRYEPRPPDLVSQVVGYVFQHAGAFSVNEMAESLGLSRRHLHRVFKGTIGVSIKKFHEIVVLRSVIDRRLSKADDSLTQLAYRANYSDQAHMVRVFRKLTQNAPRRFFAKGELLGQADTFWHMLG